MTDQELIDYYANLLILQYLQEPNAYATIQALVKPTLMDQLPSEVMNAFAVPTAEGVQLDVIGKYVGVSRVGYTFAGPIVLNDANFSILIQIKIFTNNSGSSLADIQTLIKNFFDTQILVFDYKTMRMSYFLNIGSKDLVEMIILQGLLPKPMGVQLGVTIYAPIINTFFGFRTYDLPGVNNTPFNNYTSYNMAYPWLSYANGLVA